MEQKNLYRLKIREVLHEGKVYRILKIKNVNYSEVQDSSLSTMNDRNLHTEVRKVHGDLLGPSGVKYTFECNSDRSSMPVQSSSKLRLEPSLDIYVAHILPYEKLFMQTIIKLTHSLQADHKN